MKQRKKSRTKSYGWVPLYGTKKIDGVDYLQMFFVGWWNILTGRVTKKKPACCKSAKQLKC